eukprot:CAMPEP_0204252032 /NCGR_PEP_ID=MMETSP0468-20130131/809_1 /ASSEMBLY_ACC=CAM_ASM_000383 /TAXON_ID=2969 /ORGANISM="Oxyrrhis marina" /LENGTH=83 /DNA_ID=CAMNT_0051225409 /DNA_START=27 /DNA_END=278 /DNA_ORIENTATION=-
MQIPLKPHAASHDHHHPERDPHRVGITVDLVPPLNVLHSLGNSGVVVPTVREPAGGKSHWGTTSRPRSGDHASKHNAARDSVL